MSKLTMVGLGAMGTALAASLIENGHDLTAWNRSAAKAQTIADRGGEVTTSLKEAIAASPVILICIHGYAATLGLLEDPEIRPLLRGRTVIQMSTGTPSEARAAQDWIHQQGGRYLDCAIMVYPTSIGNPDAQLLVAGEEEVYRECTTVINCLGGDVRYLGSKIGAAAALDMAAVTRLVSITVAIVYGIHICESEGVALHHFTGLYPAGDRSHHLAANIEAGEFDRNIAATVGTSIEVVSAIRGLATDLGTNAELPEFILGLYRRAADAGFGQLDNGSLIKVFRGDC